MEAIKSSIIYKPYKLYYFQRLKPLVMGLIYLI